MIERVVIKVGRKHMLAPPPQYGTVRVRAQAVLHGPANITVRQLCGEGFYGWPVLTLEAQASQADKVESRIVYANPFNEGQHVAVLRSVYWDGEAARKAYREQGQRLKLSMPARFVQIPADQVREWVSQFDGVGIVINDAVGESGTVDIRRLRIERDYKSSVFEKIWQMQDADHALLNRRWGHVWQHMTDALESKPLIPDPDEDFWLGRPWFVYDMQGYQPGQLAIA